MGSVTSLGAGSGIDLEGLLTRLVEAQRTPAAARLDNEEAQVQASISAYGGLKGALAEFQSVVSDLKDLEDFQARTATSSDTDIFSATATSSAAIGSVNINVLNLAEANKLISGSFAGPTEEVGTGTLNIEAGGDSFSIEITSGSLADVRDAINSSPAGEKLSASIITVDALDEFDDPIPGETASKLVLTAKETGAANAIQITVNDDDGNNEDDAGLSRLLFEEGNANNRLTELDAATDARITIEGSVVSSSTNEFKDAIEGVTITALKASEDPINNPPEVLTVALNETAIQGRLSAFVSVYNTLKDTFTTLTGFNTETGVAGLLNGDATVRSARVQLERTLFSFSSGSSEVLTNLAQLGITTGEGGRLAIDQETLDGVIDTNFDEVSLLFSGETGLATQLDDLISGFLSSDGSLTSREQGFRNDLEDIDDDRIKLEQSLAATESLLRQQFTGLDILVSQLNSTGDFLLAQLANTNSIVTNNSNNNNR